MPYCFSLDSISRTCMHQTVSAHQTSHLCCTAFQITISCMLGGQQRASKTKALDSMHSTLSMDRSFSMGSSLSRDMTWLSYSSCCSRRATRMRSASLFSASRLNTSASPCLRASSFSSWQHCPCSCSIYTRKGGVNAFGGGGGECLWGWGGGCFLMSTC